MRVSHVIAASFCCFVVTIVPSMALALEPFAAAPDQVLVLYNADWERKSEGTAAANDSREVAEYYVRMHTDPSTGKRPHLLGLTCKHLLSRHLNNWFIKEESNDNGNGIVYRGKSSPPPDPSWIRDSRKVELRLERGDTDWDSVRITVRSNLTGEEVAVPPLRKGLKVSGIPDKVGNDAAYPPVTPGKGRTYRFDATEFFSGPVTVRLKARDRESNSTRDISVVYHDRRDFVFSPVGIDGKADDTILETDVLEPVRAFLTDPANALPGGTLLKDHILYIVVVHGMPYAAKAVFGIERGVTSNRSDHGSLASLEQRLQTLFYPWMKMRPPVIPFYMAGGPQSKEGVVNHIITTAMRLPLYGSRINPYIHPDTYSFLRPKAPPPTFEQLPSFPQQRKSPSFPFYYGVNRIDGKTVEDAKRMVDYAVYASRYLRPEMDCRVRAKLERGSEKDLGDLAERLQKAESLWGNQELEFLGFGPAGEFVSEGLPFMQRTPKDGTAACASGKPDWQVAGFYPGGMERKVTSSNGLNNLKADVWKHLEKGVSVTAAGAPAYSGGPHITNATFWDNRILLKYLFRGRDLGEMLLRSSYYVNWATSLLGDPLLHPDLGKTVVDRVPPRIAAPPVVSFDAGISTVDATIAAELTHDPATPEVALLKVTAREEGGNEFSGISPLYSRRPKTTIPGLKKGTRYIFSATLVDPYGNETKLEPFPGESGTADSMRSLFKRIVDGTKNE